MTKRPPRNPFGITRGHAGWMALALALVSSGCKKTPAPPSREFDPKARTLFVVNYAHLDTQWRWSFPLTIREYLPNTIERNAQYFARFSDYTFSFTGASRYQLIQEYYPDQFVRVRDWVKAGRWFPAGNQWEECDVLVPSSESILRQILYGRQFFQQEFASESQEFMLPDSFGFPASLPSLLAHAGLRGFSTQKLTWDPAVKLPFNIGRWLGADNRGVVAALNAGDYGAKLKEPLNTSPAWLERLDANGRQGKKPGSLRIDYLYNGTGDRGGAPHEVSMQTVNQSAHTDGPIRVLPGPADRMFRALSEEQVNNLPQYAGDLLLREHSAGSLTSQAFMKQLNRHNELLANAAERVSVMADHLGANPYPTHALTSAWKLTLRSQFHDILAGTSVPKAYEYSWNDDLIAINTFAATLTDSVAAVSRDMDTQVVGVPIVVYNPLSIPRTDLVELTLPESLKHAPAVVALDPEGHPISTQLLEGPEPTRRVIFLATVPADSLNVYAIRPGVSPQGPPTLGISQSALENEQYRIELNADGDISRILDRRSQREMLSGPIRLAFQSEYPSEFPAWNMDWADRSQPPRGYVQGPAEVRPLEKGPLRVALSVEREAEGSRFKQTIRLGAGGAGDIIDFYDEVDWASSECSLKVTFPWSVSNPEATYSWDLGTIARGNNRPNQYEVPTHGWIDLSSRERNYGITLLTAAKYGSDKPNDNTIRLTLLYTPGASDAFEEQRTQDFGRHAIHYGISGHRGDFRDGKSHWHAQRLEQPLLAFTVSKHPGARGRSYQLASLDGDQVTIQAIKRSESGRNIVLRLQELLGKNTQVTLTTTTPILQAEELSGTEVPLTKLKDGRASASNKLMLDFRPNQIRTIGLELGVPSSTVPPPVSRYVALNYDVDAFSFNEQRQDGNFDGQGSTYPAELISDPLSVGGITYQLGPRAPGAFNALAANGQTIELPRGYRRLFILAAGTGPAEPTKLHLGKRELPFEIAPWTGRIGQWDNRLFEGSVPEFTYSVTNSLLGLSEAYLRTERIGWYASHFHRGKAGDEPYNYCYLYSYAFELKNGESSLTLPNLPTLRVFAVTVANNDNADAVALSRLQPDVSRDYAFRRRFRNH